MWLAGGGSRVAGAAEVSIDVNDHVIVPAGHRDAHSTRNARPAARLAYRMPLLLAYKHYWI